MISSGHRNAMASHGGFGIALFPERLVVGRTHTGRVASRSQRAMRSPLATKSAELSSYRAPSRRITPFERMQLRFFVVAAPSSRMNGRPKATQPRR